MATVVDFALGIVQSGCKFCIAAMPWTQADSWSQHLTTSATTSASKCCNKCNGSRHSQLFSQALMAELKLMISASKDLVCSSASTSNASFQASPALHALIAALKEITSVCSPDHAPIVSKSVAHCHLPLFSVALTAAL